MKRYPVCLALAALFVGLLAPASVGDTQAPGAPAPRLPPAPARAATPDADDPAVLDLVGNHGVDLDDATNRLAWQDLTPDVDAVARQLLGASYAGTWIDQDDGGRIKVGVALSDNLGVLDLPPEFTDAVDVVRVEYSYAALELAVDDLGDDAAAVSADLPWGGLGLGIEPQNNLVVLDVPPPAHQNTGVAELIRKAETRYPGMVRIDVVDEPPTEDACTSQSAEPFCDPPLRAGVSIRYRNSSGTACSAGFPARSRSDRRLYLMTAGHCVRNRGLTWVTRFPGGTVHDIGPRHSCVAGRGPANNCRQGPADAALLRVTNPSGWDNARGWVYVRASARNGGVPGTGRNENYRIRQTGTSRTGMRVCKSGRISTGCGEVTRLGHQ